MTGRRRSRHTGHGPKRSPPRKSGDESARASLVTAIWPGCFRLAASVVGDAVLAQDSARSLRDRSRANPQLARCWRLRCVGLPHRRSRGCARSSPQSAFVRTSRPAHDSVDDGTAAIDVMRAAGLPADQRDVVVLFYFDDLSTEEIAKICAARYGANASAAGARTPTWDPR